MSQAPADQVNAVELAGRAAKVERDFGLDQLPRLVEAGALEGTSAHASLGFAEFEGRTTVEARVQGVIVLPCQRCMRPCDCAIDESALLAVVASDDEQDLPGGYEALLGDAERLSLGELVEEQMLLGMPLVPMHEPGQCGAGAAGRAAGGAGADERQRPFANLRELLGKGER